MKTRLIIVLIGTIISIIGFAFSFSAAQTQYFTSNYSWWNTLLLAYPNLTSGIVIGMGGIAISLIGLIFARESKPIERTCPNCGQKIT